MDDYWAYGIAIVTRHGVFGLEVVLDDYYLGARSYGEEQYPGWKNGVCHYGNLKKYGEDTILYPRERGGMAKNDTLGNPWTYFLSFSTITTNVQLIFMRDCLHSLLPSSISK